MRRALAVCVVLIAVLGAASADGSATKVTRWVVIASVTNGDQSLARVSDSSYPKHHGAGNVDSKWSARWKVRVLLNGKTVTIVPANSISVGGTAHGEYRGYYPKTQTETATYTCPIGPVGSRQLLKRLRLYAPASIAGKVHVNFGVNGEPGVLPSLKCSGDPVEPEVAKTVSAGLLTGIESVCYRDVAVAAPRFLKGNTFTVTKKFGWDPPTPAGMSRPCNGVGSPVWSAGSGTLHMTFDPY